MIGAEPAVFGLPPTCKKAPHVAMRGPLMSSNARRLLVVVAFQPLCAPMNWSHHLLMTWVGAKAVQWIIGFCVARTHWWVNIYKKSACMCDSNSTPKVHPRLG